MRFIGVDPDLSSSAFAIVDAGGKFCNGHLCKSAKDVVSQIMEIGKNHPPFCFTKAFAVESQQIIPRRPGQKFEIDPMDLIRIGQIAGAVFGILSTQGMRGYFPLPVQWKGSVPKEIHQRRVLLKAGFTNDRIKTASGYCWVEGTEFGKGDWKHLADAIGLAQYAAREFLKEPSWKS